MQVNAEFHLPTPFVQKQKYRFVRFVRSIMEDTWAVVDLSTDYFQQHSLDSAASKVNCLRRPSGVIVKRLRTYENLSEVSTKSTATRSQSNYFSTYVR